MKKLILLTIFFTLSLNIFGQEQIVLSGDRSNWSDIRTVINTNFNTLFNSSGGGSSSGGTGLVQLSDGAGGFVHNSNFYFSDVGNIKKLTLLNSRFELTDAYNNTLIGAFAGDAISFGNAMFNVFLGTRAGSDITTGDNNVFIGTDAGNNNETGNNNIFLGHRAGFNELGSNRLYIESSESASPLIYGEFDNDIVKINGTQVHSTGFIADNDVTPDVSGAEIWTYNGTANGMVITDLDNPVVGAIYTLIGNSNTYVITINDSGNFNLQGNVTLGLDDILILYVQGDNDYIELNRINN